MICNSHFFLADGACQTEKTEGMIDFTLIITLVVIGITILYLYLKQFKGKMSDNVNLPPIASHTTHTESITAPDVVIVFSTLSGGCKQLALFLSEHLNEEFQISNTCTAISEYQYEECLHTSTSIHLFIFPTYDNGNCAPDATSFFRYIRDDLLNQVRVSRAFFSHLSFAVFGSGDSAYDSNWCRASAQLHSILRKLGARHIMSHVKGDSGTGDLIDQFQAWMQRVVPPLLVHLGRKEQLRLIKHAQRSIISDSEGDDDDEGDKGEPLVDMEDMGDQMSGEDELVADGADREMVTPSLHKSLTKQGYKIIGSHSAVKLCRWTKAQLRGRGGCYKHTFYGIDSYRCMELTPALACANNWRHHKNPVAKEWKWKMDQPGMIVSEGIKEHQRMIKQLRGMPGVIPKRFEEAFIIRHCALSLVGEPILYPEVNKLMEMLHARSISSFMVTNAQFPKEIEALVPVTQMYLSVDAATEESLKLVDRPVFPDFWQRFLDSIDALREKKQRTVFRLTLVKQWNMTEIQSYAKLISRGLPGLIEIKGVTFTGNNPTSGLTIKNSPFHEEVLLFVQQLVDACNAVIGEDRYGLACEHRHSVCFLIADKRTFLVNGKWHTWIDYDKFLELFAAGEPFSAQDYMAETPEWSLFGHEAHGFDPNERRVFRKGKSGKSRDDAAVKAGIQTQQK